ncbi:hypothetical protein JL722_13532 [Aureococcus anophagefferens]|nr:hypothetical protein JL722_13532 [Aureococcus anophagefferens]
MAGPTLDDFARGAGARPSATSRRRRRRGPRRASAARGGRRRAAAASGAARETPSPARASGRSGASPGRTARAARDASEPRLSRRLALSPPDAGRAPPPSSSPSRQAPPVDAVAEPRRRRVGAEPDARERGGEPADLVRAVRRPRAATATAGTRRAPVLYTATSDPDLSRSLGRGVSEPDTSRRFGPGYEDARDESRRRAAAPTRPAAAVRRRGRDAYLAGRDGRGGDDAGDARRFGRRYARHADSDSDGEHRSVAAAELLNEATASALDMRGAKMGVLGEVLERAEADAAALRRKRQAKLLATEKELASRSARVLGPACGVVGPDGRSATLVALEAAHAAAKADGAGERRTLVALLGDEIRLQEEHERRLAALDDDLDAAKARDDFERCILLEQERKEAVASRRGLLEAIAVASSERSPRRELDVLEEELVNRRTAADLATAAPKPRLKRHEDPEPLAEEVARSNLVKAGPLGVFDEATSAWSSRDVELATDPADATSASLYVYDRDGPRGRARRGRRLVKYPGSRATEIATDDAAFHLRAPTTKERDAWLAALDPFLPAERADDAAAAGAGKEPPRIRRTSLAVAAKS